MSWIALLFMFEIGTFPMNTFAMYEAQYIADLSGTEYVRLGVDFELWDLVFIGGEVRTYMRSPKVFGLVFESRHTGYKWGEVPFSFAVHAAHYDFHIGIRWKFLEAGFRHYCTHPIVTYAVFRDLVDYETEGAYEELYFRVTAELR